MTAPTPDLIIRISLVKDDATLQELNPPVWRQFKVSSSVNLDLLQDKILAPVMGWTRNYHTYYFCPVPPVDSNAGNSNGDDRASNGADDDSERDLMKSSYPNAIHYLQDDTTSNETMWIGDLQVPSNLMKKPQHATIGDLLKQAGDRCIYVYDLGDRWIHCLEVKEVIPKEEADGKVEILDGAMRCPPEDGQGCDTYQEEILDLLLENQEKPHDNEIARKLAKACFEKRGAINVNGSFLPTEFNLHQRTSELTNALRTRNSTRNTKQVSGGGMFGQDSSFMGLSMAEIGQKHVIHKKEDDRFERMGGFAMIGESVNIKPDPKDGTLCNSCGTPHNLKECGRCHSSFYCSQECQLSHWNEGHKKKCKLEKAAIEKYNEEKKTNKPDPNRLNQPGGIIPMKKFIPGRLRFIVGDRVECLIGENKYGTGKIIKLMYREPHWPESKPPVPYQIHLDRESAIKAKVPPQYALIYSDWDDDYKVRKLVEVGEDVEMKSKKASGKGGKKNRKG